MQQKFNLKNQCLIGTIHKWRHHLGGGVWKIGIFDEVGSEKRGILKMVNFDDVIYERYPTLNPKKTLMHFQYFTSTLHTLLKFQPTNFLLNRVNDEILFINKMFMKKIH